VVREGVPLAPYSHVRIGGPARVFLEPWSEEDAAFAVRVCKEHDLPCLVLGGGSNLLIADGGLDAVVLYLGSWNRVVRDGKLLIASAGASLQSLLRRAREARLSGLEGLIGIPAQVGGAVCMNAGTHEASTFDRIVRLRIVDEHGAVQTLEKEQLHPVYRSGNLGQSIVTTATFELDEGDPKAIGERMDATLRRRNDTQPVTQRSVGCIFKNPPGLFAGKLIQDAGLKGERVGPIEVSPKHANYMVNLGGGTAAQMCELIDFVRQRVKETSGVELELEVKLWGF
jgi:UDP-N-acetylmuramate dehydrogenase